MGISISKILSSPQTYNWLAQLGGAISPEGSAGSRVGTAAEGITAAQIEQQARKKAAEEAAKKKKTGFIGELVGKISPIGGSLVTGDPSTAVNAMSNTAGSFATGGMSGSGGGTDMASLLMGKLFNKQDAANVQPTFAATGEPTLPSAKFASKNMLAPMNPDEEKKRKATLLSY